MPVLLGAGAAERRDGHFHRRSPLVESESLHIPRGVGLKDDHIGPLGQRRDQPLVVCSHPAFAGMQVDGYRFLAYPSLGSGLATRPGALDSHDVVTALREQSSAKTRRAAPDFENAIHVWMIASRLLLPAGRRPATG